MKYFIYCIKHNNDIVYIGSTNNFSQRKHKHKKILLIKEVNYTG